MSDTTNKIWEQAEANAKAIMKYDGPYKLLCSGAFHNEKKIADLALEISAVLIRIRSDAAQEIDSMDARTQPHLRLGSTRLKSNAEKIIKLITQIEIRIACRSTYAELLRDIWNPGPAKND